MILQKMHDESVGCGIDLIYMKHRDLSREMTMIVCRMAGRGAS